MTKIMTVKGLDGKNGLDGRDGKDGINGVNGRDGKDGTNGRDGKDGLNAYELALKNGYVGTEVEFLNLNRALQDGVNGADGKNGIDGANGRDGADGKDGKDGINGIDGINGKDGKDGINGLNGIDGKDGINGIDGKDGANGADGQSAYDIAVKHGFEGTEEEYAMAHLKQEKTEVVAVSLAFKKFYDDYYKLIADRSEDVQVGDLVALMANDELKIYVRHNQGAGADKWCEIKKLV